MDNIKHRDIQTGIKMGWHGKTNVVPVVTAENAGFLYGMRLRPLVAVLEDGATVETAFAQIIAEDDDLPIGGCVGKDYGILSNQRIWELVQDSLSTTHHKIVSCGTVADRSKAFISVQLDDSFVKMAGRDTRNVLNFLFGHGGSLSFLVNTGNTVVVCENTFNLALASRGDFQVRIKHTRFAEHRLAGVERAIEAHFGVLAEFKMAMDDLANESIDEADACRLFAGVITPREEIKMSSKTGNKVDRLTELFGSGKGNRGNDLSDVFNAATDYYSHESSGGQRDPWKQYVTSEFGSGQKWKEDFFTVLRAPEKVRDAIKRGDKLIKAS